MSIDLKKVDNIQFDGIDHRDYPDYSDAFISECDYDGIPATDIQLDMINDERDFLHEKLFDYLF